MHLPPISVQFEMTTLRKARIVKYLETFNDPSKINEIAKQTMQFFKEAQKRHPDWDEKDLIELVAADWTDKILKEDTSLPIEVEDLEEKSLTIIKSEREKERPIENMEYWHKLWKENVHGALKVHKSSLGLDLAKKILPIVEAQINPRAKWFFNLF